MPEVLAVGAVAIRDGALLLVKRGRPPAVGRWSLPGGKVEPGESETDAVAREVAEETGLTVTVGRLLGEVTRDGPGGTVFRIRDYAVEVASGTAVAGDDAAAAQWVALSELSDYDLTEGLVEALRAWQVFG